MYCYNCGSRLSEMDYCTACGTDVRQYKKIMYAANRYYNDGLERAGVRDLSGAIYDLKLCLRLNRKHVDALNLLGLIYYEMGETVQALSMWVLSLNIQNERNVAAEYVESIQSNQARIDSINQTIKKYNKSLDYCYQDSYDLAVLQLKKVLKMSPKFVSAHKLLALCYMRRGEWEKANRELDRTQLIDNGDVDVRRYKKEVDNMLHPVEDVKGDKKKKALQQPAASAYYSQSGNDIIIQPNYDKEPLGLQTFLMIALGLVIGIFVAVALITPAKVKSTRNEMEAQITSYGEQLDAKNSEINTLETRISQLEQNNLSLQQNSESYDVEDGAMDANNALIAAAYAFLDPSQSNMAVEQYLNNISEDYIMRKASPEFLELQEYLIGQIGDSVATTYYESGIQAYNEKDYALAISNLQKAYLYDSNSEEALYYLGLAYYESGDVASATTSFQDLINVFPGSVLEEKARQKLSEISE